MRTSIYRRCWKGSWAQDAGLRRRWAGLGEGRRRKPNPRRPGATASSADGRRSSESRLERGDEHGITGPDPEIATFQLEFPACLAAPLTYSPMNLSNSRYSALVAATNSGTPTAFS